MASDETRRARPDPTAQDSGTPANGDAGAPTSADAPRRTDPVEWANGPAKSGRAKTDADPNTAPQVSQPDPMATSKMAAMPQPGWDNRDADRPAPGPGPGRPNGPGGWQQGGPQQGGPPRGWPPPPGPPPPGPAHSWPPSGPVSAWPPPPPPPVEQKGPSNKV
ncbi:MAG: hypothetical protein QOC74_4579, partial [Pseudonocardiales bacterium]|nr:hypothetical protein [Pseudonocardiales bacterium]